MAESTKQMSIASQTDGDEIESKAESYSDSTLESTLPPFKDLSPKLVTAFLKLFELAASSKLWLERYRARCVRNGERCHYKQRLSSSEQAELLAEAKIQPCQNSVKVFLEFIVHAFMVKYFGLGSEYQKSRLFELDSAKQAALVWDVHMLPSE